MKTKTTTILLFVVLLCACSDESSEFRKIEYSSEAVTAEMFLSGLDNTNAFLDLYITDSFAVFIDFYNDTVVQLYNKDKPELSHYVTKGQGPDEVIMPMFSRAVVKDAAANQVGLYDVDSNAYGTIEPDPENKTVNKRMERVPAKMPFTLEINIFEDKIIGIDQDRPNSLIYKYDKTTDALTSVPFFPTPKDTYSEDQLPFLYHATVCANEEKNRIFVAMMNLSVIQIYDFNLERKDCLLIGDKLRWPVADPNIMDFPNNPKYFIHGCGTKQHVYLLYKGADSNSEIFVFDWDGTLREVLKSDLDLMRIGVDKDDSHIWGLYDNEEGGTDVVKF